MDRPNPSGGFQAFPHFDEKYKCCCGSVHVKQGTYMIGILSAIQLFFVVVSAIFSHESVGIVVADYGLSAIKLFCLVFLFLGLRKNRKKYIIPFAVHETCCVIVYIVGVGLCLWAAVEPQSRVAGYMKSFIDPQDRLTDSTAEDSNLDLPIRLMATMLITALILSILISLWLLKVIYKCYAYLADLDDYHKQIDGRFHSSCA
ncbi:unnamed protein product [Auanema sp. JU1783]|nr:unnamed protein product [Auanema sp. JU1783]